MTSPGCTKTGSLRDVRSALALQERTGGGARAGAVLRTAVATPTTGCTEAAWMAVLGVARVNACCVTTRAPADRKSTRLNSSHGYISYAVFCLKKKKKYTPEDTASAVT